MTNNNEKQLATFRDKCIKDITEITGIKREFILAKRRGKDRVVDARFLLYRALYYSDFAPPMQEVARMVGRKDHATIFHALNVSDERMRSCYNFKRASKALECKGYRLTDGAIGGRGTRLEARKQSLEHLPQG